MNNRKGRNEGDKKGKRNVWGSGWCGEIITLPYRHKRFLFLLSLSDITKPYKPILHTHITKNSFSTYIQITFNFFPYFPIMPYSYHFLFFFFYFDSFCVIY